jgi:hypothetical protein
MLYTSLNVFIFVAAAAGLERIPELIHGSDNNGSCGDSSEWIHRFGGETNRSRCVVAHQ